MESLELGSMRSLMHHTQGNSLDRQPGATGITPCLKPWLLLCQVFGWLTLAHQPWIAVAYGWNGWSGAIAAKLPQPPPISKIISLLHVNHVSKLYNTLRATQKSSSVFFCRSTVNSASSKCLILSVLQVIQSSPGKRLWSLCGYFLRQVF